MSAKVIETVLTRAMCDADFAALLLEHPEQALTGYDLTTEETAKFERLSQADFEAFSDVSLEERKTFGVTLITLRPS